TLAITAITTGIITSPRPKPEVRRTLLVVWLLGAMIVWAVFAVGGVYIWAGAPLIIGAALLAAIARPRPAASSDTWTLDLALLAFVLAAGVQLVPMPPAVRAVLSPHAESVRSAMHLEPTSAAAWHPLSVSPASTAYALGLVLASLVVFWTARKACASGM